MNCFYIDSMWDETDGSTVGSRNKQGNKKNKKKTTKAKENKSKVKKNEVKLEQILR